MTGSQQIAESRALLMIIITNVNQPEGCRVVEEIEAVVNIL
jgi:hypothetical protein